MLTVDGKSRKMTADVINADRIEKYECILTGCPNPVCTCGSMYLEMTPVQEDENVILEKRKVEIGLDERSLSYKDIGQVPKDELKFSEAVLSQLNQNDFQLLKERYWAIKNKMTEEAPPESIEAHFKYHEIENGGLMYAYNDVLPYGNQFLITIVGKKFIVFDQYCILPKCSCTDTVLSFFEIEESRNKTDELFAISIDYKKKKWDITKDGLWPVDIKILKSSLLDAYPDFYKQIKTRHFKLKAIYTNCKKKNYSLQQNIFTQKVGRNDPCPCGSGKKFKKCCFNKP